MVGKTLFHNIKDSTNARVNVGSNLAVVFLDKSKKKVGVYRFGDLIKTVDISDKSAYRILVVDLVEMGAVQNRLKDFFDISRQTIHNYIQSKKHFGVEGLTHGYTPSTSKSRRIQREGHSKERSSGSKAKLLMEMRRDEIRKRKESEPSLDFGFANDLSDSLPEKDQLFSEEHDWRESRYAGVFCYLVSLTGRWNWLNLVMGHFGSLYRVFIIFLFMAARNTPSIEQLKNVWNREAGIVLGIRKLPGKLKVWELFYQASKKSLSRTLLHSYFSSQFKSGSIGCYLWFLDGHLLPYTGHEKVRYSYNTQRRMPVPGQTNFVTCDITGRIVDFEIQEGKGDMKEHVMSLYKKWSGDVCCRPVMVFDREVYDGYYFYRLIESKTLFVTWEKYLDSKALSKLNDSLFVDELTVNDRKYRLFEEEKTVNIPQKEGREAPASVTLRRINIWNLGSNRRACGLAWTDENQMSASDCAEAILNRWGASENTFKHIQTRHPFHYHPGFGLSESRHQDITNPRIKEVAEEIKVAKKELNKLYKKAAKSGASTKKEVGKRQQDAANKLKDSIRSGEANISSLKEEKKDLPEKINVLGLDDYRSFKQIDNEGKNLFDFATSSVWNARKEMIDMLRPFYDRENDLIDLFYAIINCHGWVKSTKEEVIVRLEPLQQLKRRSAQEMLCRKLSGLGVRTPNGKWMRIEIGSAPEIKSVQK